MKRYQPRELRWTMGSDILRMADDFPPMLTDECG
jgi:hypothetical protein